MDFHLTREQKMLQRSVQEYLRDKITPVADEYDRKGPMSKIDAHKFLKGLQPFGFISSVVPVKYGGDGLSYMDVAIINLELNKAYASLAGIAFITSTSAVAIANCGNEMLKKKYLPSILNAQAICCTAITEPNVGSDPSSIETTAVLEGDHYLINGTKMWISNGSIADFAILICAADNAGEGRGAIFQILVDRAKSPYQVNEIHKLGLRSFPTSELIFENCRVPKENVLNPAGQGFDHTQKILIAARCSAALAGVGLAQAAIEAAKVHLKKRVQFGQKIGKFQMMQQLLAEMIIETEAARLLTFQAFKLMDEGAPCRMESSIAKAYACEIGWKVASKAIQIHGAYGLADEYPLERYFRDARCFPIPDGTTQIQQLIIAREALGMSALR